MPTGVARYGAGWRAAVRVNGTLHRKTFPLATPLDVMQTWRLRTRLAYHETRAVRGTFADDVERYLAAVAAMPTIGTRRRILERWVAELGGQRLRSSITTVEIQTVLQRWLRDGDAETRATTRKGGRRPERLAVQTVKHRRNALRHLWTTLDGRDAPNPVRAVAVPRAPTPAVRELTPQAIGAVFSVMRPSTTRTRLLLMAATGLPQRSVMALEPGAFDADSGTLAVAGRAKGRTTPGRLVPVAPVVADIWQDFCAREAFGPFSTASMRTALRRAAATAVKRGLCAPADVATITPYDLRHAFGALLYRTTGDQPTVARLLGHVDLRTTRRYTMAAHADLDRAAVTSAAAVLTAFGTGAPSSPCPDSRQAP